MKSKFQLKRMVHRFNMAWRKYVPAGWRLRLTENRGVYTLWNAQRMVYVAKDAVGVSLALMSLNTAWARMVRRRRREA